MVYSPKIENVFAAAASAFVAAISAETDAPVGAPRRA